MELANYAKIGREQLLCLIGLQENYRKEIKVLDAAASGCSCCPNNAVNRCVQTGCYSDLTDHCENCPNAVYQTRVIYCNERNQYARWYQDTEASVLDPVPPRLKSGAIRLFIALHFFNINTQTGMIQSASLRELADLLGCDKKTIINNLELLSKYEYIHTILHKNGHASIIIRNYKKLFHRASEGGRGFILLNKDLLTKILSYSKTNDLRLVLRVLHELTLQQEKGGNHKARLVISYEELRRYLPFYVKPHIIRKCLTEISSLFSDIRTASDQVALHLKSDYQISKIQSALRGEYQSEIADFLSRIRSAIEKVNSDLSPENMRQLRDDYGIRSTQVHYDDDLKPTYSTYGNIYLTRKNRDDMVQLAVEYSLSEVLDAIIEYYNDFVQAGNVANELGAVIRTTIRSNREFLNVA